MSKIKVVIVLEGGLVQAICSPVSLEDFEFEVVDYDTEGADADELSNIPYVDGSSGPGIRRGEAVTSPSDIDWSRLDHV